MPEGVNDSSVPEGVAVISEARASPSVLAGGNADADGITTFGMVRIENPDAEDMELVGVRVNATPGVEIVDILAVPPDPPAGSWDGGGPGLPPQQFVGDDAASVGATLSGGLFATDDGTPHLQVLLVLRVPDSDVHAVNGVDVSYRIAGEERDRTFDYGHIFCIESPDCARTLQQDTELTLDDLGLLAKQT